MGAEVGPGVAAAIQLDPKAPSALSSSLRKDLPEAVMPNVWRVANDRVERASKFLRTEGKKIAGPQMVFFKLETRVPDVLMGFWIDVHAEQSRLGVADSRFAL